MVRTPLVLLLALAACSAAGGPAPASGGGGPRVELTSRQLESGPTLTDPGPGAPPAAPAAGTATRAEGEAGAIAVNGQMQTPDPCRRLSGTVEAAGAQVTLHVDAAREGEMCTQVIATFAYDARITGLAPGTYRLRVVHAYPGTGWDARTALEQSVTVR